MTANLPIENSAPSDQPHVRVCILAPQHSHHISAAHSLPSDRHQLIVFDSIDKLVKSSLIVNTFDNGLIDAIDIVLLDIDLIAKNPSELIKALVTLFNTRYVPIILLSDTSADHSEILIKAMTAGAHDFIEMPIEPSLFAAKVATQTRIAETQLLVQQQNAQIMENHKYLLHEQRLAEEVFNKVSQNNGIDMANIRHWLSPIAVFNGDVLLAAPTPRGGLIVLLGDFTGHGLSAAIGAIPLASTFYSMVEKGFAMSDIVKELNAKLHEILPVSVFCCASVVQFNFDEGIVDIWNAGLPDCFVLRQNNSMVEKVESNGLALGIMSAGEYHPKPTRFNLLSGDRLYLLSDGVLEAANNTGEQFGDERLLDVITRQVNVDGDKAFKAIKQQVIDFIGGHSRADDISLVEITMMNADDFAAMNHRTKNLVTADPASWHFSYEVRPDSLRYQDPIPLLLHTLMEVPTLRRYSGQLFTILTELYNNALDHGLLGLSSDLKQAPEGFKSYYSARNHNLQRLAQGSVRFALDYQGDDKCGTLVVDVMDSGKGFDYAALPTLTSTLRQEKTKADTPNVAASITGEHSLFSGRGISLLQSICTSVEYLGCGNHARVQFNWQV